MAHKTRVSGTNYSISGGKCRVSGTNYSIKKGRTRVSGTGYNINFAPDYDAIVDITSIISTAKVTINGKNYTSATTGIGVNYGDVITFTNTGGGRCIKTEDGYSFIGDSPLDWTIPNGLSKVSISIKQYKTTEHIEVVITKS